MSKHPTAAAGRRRTNLLLLLAILLLVVVSYLIGLRSAGSEFAGADGQAVEMIEEANPDYQAWWAPVFEPSSEVASGLFALQAGIGGGILGYVAGVFRGRRKTSDVTDAESGAAPQST